MDTTIEARKQLDQLVEQRGQIQNALNDCAARCDAEGLIKLKKDLENNSIRQYAFKAKLLGLDRDERERERKRIISEKTKLEDELKTVAANYQIAIGVADALRVEVQTLGVRLFALDSSQEVQRLERNEADTKYKKMIATWQENALKPPERMACDLD